MMKFRLGYKSLILVMALFVVAGFAAQSSVSRGVPALSVIESAPFVPGEKLVYKLKWGIIPAGKMILEVQPMKEIDGEQVYHFILTAETTGLIDKFYKYRTSSESFVDDDFSRSFKFIVHEKKKNDYKDVEVTFDWVNQEMVYVKNDNARPPQFMEQGTLDPLAILYAMRQMKLSVGEELQSPVSDGKRMINGSAKVIKEEWIRTDAGKFKAVVVEPKLDEAGGVFAASKDPELQLWISKSNQRIPLRFSSKVILGHFVGELVKIVRS